MRTHQMNFCSFKKSQKFFSINRTSMTMLILLSFLTACATSEKKRAALLQPPAKLAIGERMEMKSDRGGQAILLFSREAIVDSSHAAKKNGVQAGQLVIFEIRVVHNEKIYRLAKNDLAKTLFKSECSTWHREARMELQVSSRNDLESLAMLTDQRKLQLEVDAPHLIEKITCQIPLPEEDVSAPTSK